METITFQPMSNLRSAVVRVHENDKVGVHLATFEYGYQAAKFARALSRESDGVIAVLDSGRTYFSETFEGGKKHKGFAVNLQVSA